MWPSGRRPLSWWWPLALPVAVAALVFTCAGSSSSPSRLSADRVLGPLPVPPDNPQTPEKVELGKPLFFDKRLSADNTMACATCHDPARGWSDGLVSCDGCFGLDEYLEILQTLPGGGHGRSATSASVR